MSPSRVRSSALAGCFDLDVIAINLEKISIQLKWFHQFQFAGYYAAKEKGFYAEEGLDVSILARDPAKSHIQAVLDGSAQPAAHCLALSVEQLAVMPAKEPQLVPA